MSAIDRVKELLAAAEDDRTCDEQYGPFRGGCDECGRYSNKGAVAAKRALERAGFSRVGGKWPAAEELVALAEHAEVHDRDCCQQLARLDKLEGVMEGGK